LRQPLSALGMLAHLLEAGGLSPEQEAEDFAALRSELAHLDRLVTDVAATAAAERESFSVDLRPTPLQELLDTAAAFAEVALANHPFTVRPAPDVLVSCDAARLGQILRNLLQNCATHTPDGTPVELRALQDGARVRFEVADRGPGLAPDELRRIFEKFGRGRAASRRQTPGSGLGLYLARRIALAHGTDLEVTSAPGEGTTFAFSLPVVP
jgi:signal transduction histidine kinase